ncbi:MAG: hypothetical protein WCL39_03295, partial [Armatimonadota bacterium]
MNSNVDCDTVNLSPRWAVVQREAMNALRRYSYWWFDRMDPDKGLGFGDDDVESVLLSVPILALGQDDQRTRHALELVADQMWYRYGFFDGDEKGYPCDPESDVEHAAEPISNSQTKMLLVDYGNPKFVERCMVSSSNVEQWTAVNELGNRHFRSFHFGAEGVSTSRYMDVDTPVCARALVPNVFLAWYNRDPVLMQYLVEYGNTWRALGMSNVMGKPVGEFPSEVRFRDGKVGAYSGAWNECAACREFERLNYNMYSYMLSLYMLTGDEGYLDPHRSMALLGVQSEGVEVWSEHVLDYRVFTGRNDLDDAYATLAQKNGLWRWLTTGDKDGLIHECEKLRDNIVEKFDERTIGIDFDDPMSNYATCIDETVLSLMYTGGLVHHVGAYPYVAATWSGTDHDFCALVLDHGPDYLKALVYSFGSEPQRVGMNVWELDPGVYSVRCGLDTRSEDSIAELKVASEADLLRGSRIDIDLMPGVVHVVEIKKIRALTVTSRADVAIGPDDLVCSIDSPRPGAEVTLSVVVHNLGTAAASDVSVQFVELPSNRVIAQKTIAVLDAPHNMVPSRFTVSADWTVSDDVRAVRVVLLPDSECEITDVNNSCEWAIEDLKKHPFVPRVEPQERTNALMPTLCLSAKRVSCDMVVDGKIREEAWGEAETAELAYRMYYD